MLPESMGPDERALRTHLAEGPFQNGMDRGYWRLLSVAWPQVFMAVSTAPRERGLAEYIFRIDCTNYPQWAPTARLWDLERNAPLEPGYWPNGHDRVPKVFRPDWKSGECLYLPCDRLSVEGHEAWRHQHPHLIWSASSDITLYLGAVHELLNSSDYTGPRSA